MRNIKVEAKSVDQAIEKGLQMLGVNREEVEIKVLNEGSMLKKASVEIYTFANAEEREEYLKNNKEKNEVKLVKTAEEESFEITTEGVDEVTAVVTEFLLKELDTATVDDVVITDYYGLFDDVVFFIYKSPLKYYVNALKYEEVGEEVFVYQNGNRIYGFDGKRLYTLTEAFDAGLIEGSDIATLKEYHTAYYPFAVDLYGSELIGESIDKIN